MSRPVGRHSWAIAEGYIPPASTGTSREMTSHETVCILNAGGKDAHVEIMVYFADRAPAGPYKFTVGAERTMHLRFNDFTEPEPVPVNTDFSSVITADVPIVVQHTRLELAPGRARAVVDDGLSSGLGSSFRGAAVWAANPKSRAATPPPRPPRPASAAD